MERCPFCGVLHYQAIEFDGKWRGKCLECGAMGPEVNDLSEVDKAWNHRFVEVDDGRERPTYEYSGDIEAYCPFVTTKTIDQYGDILKTEGRCMGARCMMWVLIGNNGKGRCGLVGIPCAVGTCATSCEV